MKKQKKLRLCCTKARCFFLSIFSILFFTCVHAQKSDYDIGVSSIDSPTIFCTGGTQNVYARVTNFGKKQVTGFTVNWSIDGTIQTLVTSTASLDTAGGAGTNSITVMLGGYNFISNVSAQIKAWSDWPGVFAYTLTPHDSAATWKMTGLSGNLSIGGGGASFPDMAAAVFALKAGGVCGPVHFTVNPGTYTGQVDLKNIGGASYANTITFEGVDKNTCIVSFNAVATANDYSVIAIDNTPYVTLRNLSVINTGTAAGFGIVIQNGSHYTTVKNCIVTVGAGASTTFLGICISGTRRSTGTSVGTAMTAARADFVEIDACTINNGNFAFGSYGPATILNTGLKFTNNTVVNYANTGIYMNNNSAVLVENNIISGVASSQLAYGMFFGVLSVGGSNNIISRNKLTNIGIYGIYIANGTNAVGRKGVIANNFIGNGTTTTTNGIYLTGCTYWTMAHNTIRYNIVSATASYTPALITGGTNNAVFNNVFHSKSNGATFYGSAASVFDTLDYNLYSRTTKGASYFYLGAYYTDVTFKSVSGFNANSLTTDPGFINDTALLLTKPCLTGMLSVITTDYFGATRSAVAPTLGAAEHVGLPDDVMIVEVKKPVVPFASGLQDAEVLVKNAGTTTLTSFTVSYTNNGGSSVNYNWTGSLAPCDTTRIVFAGSNQLDLDSSHNLVFYTSLPNTVADPNTANDTLYMRVAMPLNGNYSIGVSPADYPTLQAAASDLKNFGMTGPVTFTADPGTYSGQLRIEGPVWGNNAMNTITFQGVDATTRIIDANIAQPAVLINGVSYVTFKNFTVNNASAATNTGGIGLVGNDIDNRGTMSTISHNIINLPNTGASAAYGINITGSVNAAGQSSNRMDSITVDSNVVNGGSTGISFYGKSANAYNRLARIRGNVLNKNYSRGIYSGYIYNAVEISGNTIIMDTGSATNPTGVYFDYCQDTLSPHRISNNKIANASIGLRLSNFTSPAATPMQVSNNIVTGKAKYFQVSGINIVGNTAYSNINCYHNTLLSQSGVNGTAELYGIYYVNPNATAATVVNIKNNILGNLNTNISAGIPLYLGKAITGNSVNYNSYYNLGTNSLVNNVGTIYTTSNYKTANAGGDSSFNINPKFSNPLVPILTEGCLRGENLNAGVPADYYGMIRSNAPNLGAVEFVGSSNDLTMEAMLYPVMPVALGAQDLAVKVRNNGTNMITSFNVAYTHNNGTPVVYNWTGTLNPCEVATVIYTGASQVTMGSGINNIRVYSYDPNTLADAYPANDTITVALAEPLTGHYIVGAAPSDFTTFTEAVNALNSRGVSGPVQFNIKTGTYNESIELNGVIGASAINTITFTSLDNHADSVKLAYAAIPTRPYVVYFHNLARYYVLDRITVSQLSANVENSLNIRLTGATSFDTIRNCKITSPNLVASTTYNIYGVGMTGEGVYIHENEITGGGVGITMSGVDRVNGFKNVVVNKNTISGFYYGPIYYFGYNRSSAVTNNIFNATASTYAFAMQMAFQYCDSGFQNTGNILNTASGKSLNWYNEYSNNSSMNKSIIANNQIKGGGSVAFMIGNTATNNQDIVHNTFNLNAGYFQVTPSTNTVRVMNNIFTGTSYVYRVSAAPTLANLTSNHNQLHTTGANAYYAGGAARTASYFRTTYPQHESRSVYTRAGLTGSVPNITDTGCWNMNGTGAFLGYALNDANGNPRPQTLVEGAPDLGAFEFTPDATTEPPVLVAVPATPAAGTTQAFLMGLDTVAQIIWDASAAVPDSITGRLYTGAYPPGISGATDKSLNMYWKFEAPAGTYNYNIKLYFRPTLRGLIITAADMIGAKKIGSSPWVVYHASQSTVDSVAGILTINSLTDFSLFTGTDANNPLPVALSRFSATVQRNDVQLNWTTASEQNNKGFEIERSVDGIHFDKISFVKGAGNSASTLNYNLLDKDAFAKSQQQKANSQLYYRLKQVDFNGAYTYSNTIRVTIHAGKANAFSVFPNPYSNSFSISFTSPDEGNTTIEIMDIQGKVVAAQDARVASGANTILMNEASVLRAGIYFLKVTINGETQVMKIVKQ
jgi:hypothetical protein